MRSAYTKTERFYGESVAALRAHFPDARLVRRAEADARLEQVLRNYPRSLAFRRTNPLAPKLFDFAVYLNSDRMALFDSDLLFFSQPAEFLRRLEDPRYRLNTFNGDCGDGYAIPQPDLSRLVHHEVLPGINSGLGLVHRDSIHWDWIEEYLGLPGMHDGHFWRIEQTVFALCSSRYGVELLPPEYTVSLDRKLDANVSAISLGP